MKIVFFMRHRGYVRNFESLLAGLAERGHEVVAIMTHAATRFVGPVTFEAITRRQVITDQFAPGLNADIEHIAIASSIDLLLVAPATANIIGKLGVANRVEAAAMAVRHGIA